MLRFVTFPPIIHHEMIKPVTFGALSSFFVATLLLACRQVNISQRDNAENDAVETAGVGAVHGDTEVGEIPMATMLRRQAKTLFTGNSPGPLSTGKSQDMTSTTIVPGEVTRRTDTPREGDLCMGMAVGISAAQLVTFVASFRENSPLADLVLFFEAPASARFREIIEKCVIRFVAQRRAPL